MRPWASLLGRVPGERLLLRLVLQCVLGVVMLAALFPWLTTNAVLLGLLVSVPTGIYYLGRLTQRIDGNVYHDPERPLPQRIAVAGVLCLLGLGVGVASWSDSVLRLLIPLAIPFPTSTLFLTAWLLRYERKVGPVLVRRRSSDS